MEVTNNWNICKIFKKPPPRALKIRFLEHVNMDLKLYSKHTLIHTKDHATRLSAVTVIPSKKPEIIVKKKHPCIMNALPTLIKQYAWCIHLLLILSLFLSHWNTEKWIKMELLMQSAEYSYYPVGLLKQSKSKTWFYCEIPYIKTFLTWMDECLIYSFHFAFGVSFLLRNKSYSFTFLHHSYSS